jgi:hypothetical protein
MAASNKNANGDFQALKNLKAAAYKSWLVQFFLHGEAEIHSVK